MPRQKLSELRAKSILSEALDLAYAAWPIDSMGSLDKQLGEIKYDGRFVLKIDEGVKGRFKKGLVKLDLAFEDLPGAINELSSKGYRWMIIEPMLSHDNSGERYLSLLSDRSGWSLQFTASGGINVEDNAQSIQKVVLGLEVDWDHIAAETKIKATDLQKLLEVCRENYFVFTEVNPYLVDDNGLHLLDAAVEVDDAASFFVRKWDPNDLRHHTEQALTDEEKVVHELDANSPASLKLSVLEPNGSIFLLLSGGGASVVVADEVYNQGYGHQLANYGEYSGNPNSEETYLYTKAVLQLLIKSSAKQKVLFIGGAVANFTDIAKTFAGVMKAIDEVADTLREQAVKVYVRRGGPNQEAGLVRLRNMLQKDGLLGAVHDPETPLTDAVTEALQEINHV